MLKVGLTGGIASGKTTAAEMFAARGCRVLNADRMAHDLMRPGQPAFEEIVQRFGRDVLAADGSIDRSRLGQIVFADPAKLVELNRILHPRVVTAIEKEFAAIEGQDPGAIALVEAALLVEAGYHKKLDTLVLTWCRPEQQVERLLKKGLSRAEAEQRIAAQLPVEEKRRHADYVIDSSGPLEATTQQVEKILGTLRKLEEARRGK